MKIIIVGCGKVGYTLAETLSREKHEITVIDNNEEKISRLSNELDVAAVRGNGGSYSVLKQAGVERCELLIAATGHDEVNLLCCLIARKASGCRTIARVRDPNYYNEISFIQEELGLSLAINPELAAASACYQLVRAPFAMEQDSFADGRAQLLTFRLADSSPWVGRSLMSINRAGGAPFLIALLNRRGQAIIPSGGTVLEGGDLLSVVVDRKAIRSTLENIGIRYRPIRSVMIAAGGNVGYYLAKRLCEDRVKVTIIDSDRKRCEELISLLPGAAIICGDPCSEKTLLEEGADRVDAFCSLTANDAENLMMSLFVGKLSRARVITRVNRLSASLFNADLALGAVVSPKELTAERILCYVRTMASPNRSSSMEAIYRLAGDQVEALAFQIEQPSAATGKRLMELKIRPGTLVCAIIRGDRVIIPTGQDSICLGDQVVIVTTRRGVCDLKDILR